MASIRGVSSLDSGGTAKIGSYLVETGDKSGLVQLIDCALRLTEAESGPPMLLDIETQPAPGSAWLGIQASVLPRKENRLASVTLRVRKKSNAELENPKLIRSALSAFGGSRYVSFTVGSRNQRAGTFEVAIWTPGALPCLVVNEVTLPRLMTIDQADVYADVLDTLAVNFTRRNNRFSVAARQWRLPVRFDALCTAYGSAKKMSSVAIYSAALPLLQSLRFARSKVDGRHEIDCALSRGMSAKNGCSSLDLHQMEHWMAEQLNERVCNRFWRVEAYTGLGASGLRSHQPQHHHIPTGS
jgi:hypothetical protein